MSRLLFWKNEWVELSKKKISMNYKRDIINRLKDSDNWPAFERPDFLDDLNELADKAFKKKTIEGYLASLLIYHQLCEEMIKVLINCSTFFIQCSIFPLEIKPKNLKKKMFGQLMQELETCVVYEDIEDFIKKCKELNEIRNRLVHRLTLKSSVTDISNQTQKVKKMFDEIYTLFAGIYENYRLIFKDLKKDKEAFEEN